MTGDPDDGYTYEWEAVRSISEDLTLDCNFHLDAFPAVLKSRSHGIILLSGPELYKLMEEIADRFDMKVIENDSTKTL